MLIERIAEITLEHDDDVVPIRRLPLTDPKRSAMLLVDRSGPTREGLKQVLLGPEMRDAVVAHAVLQDCGRRRLALGERAMLLPVVAAAIG